MEHTLSTNGHVHYPEEPIEKDTPVWLYPLAALFYAVVIGFGLHVGLNLGGLLW